MKPWGTARASLEGSWAPCEVLEVPGVPWATAWATWWEIWGPICYTHRCFSVSHCFLLNVPLEALGAHSFRKSWILHVFAYLGVSLLNASGSRGLFGRILGQPVARPKAPYGMHTDV